MCLGDLVGGGDTVAGEVLEVPRGVPGVGAQGGSLEEVSRYGMNRHCGLLVNSSRAIIYASQGEDFAQKAREAAAAVQQEMEKYLNQFLN